MQLPVEPLLRYAELRLGGRYDPMATDVTFRRDGSERYDVEQNRVLLDQDDISRLIGVSARTLSRWLAAGHMPAGTADYCAATLNEHVSIIWPEYYDHVDKRGRLRHGVAA